MIKSGAMMFSFRKPTATYLRLAHECGNARRPRAFISSGCGIDDSSLVYGQSAVPVVMADQHIASTVVEATVSACKSSQCRLGSGFTGATSWRQELGPFFVGFANWQGLAVENMDWGPSNVSTGIKAEGKKVVEKDASLSVSMNQSSQEILELIASKECELAALRAALKAKEAANSGARHGHFTTSTSTLSPASFTPQPGQEKTLRDDPIDIPSKPPATPTVSPADATLQIRQETTLRPLPLINQRPDRIRVDRLASEKYQMAPLHSPGSFRPGSFYDKLQKMNKLVVNEESSGIAVELNADVQEDGGEKPVQPKRIRPPPKIIPPVESKPFKSLADSLYEERFGHPAPPSLQRSYPLDSFHDRAQKEKQRREAEAKRRWAAQTVSQASGFRDTGVLGSKSSTASDLPGTRLGTTDEEDPLLRIQRMPTMPPRRIPKIPYVPSVEHRRRNNRPSPYTNQSPYNQQELMMPGDWKCERCNTNNFSRNTHCYRCQTGRSRKAGSGTQLDRPSSFRPGEQ
ncbi:unnamed protein product [Sphagnum balticum]